MSDECRPKPSAARTAPSLTVAPPPLTVLPRKERRIGLLKLDQVREEMARVYREMRRGELELQDGTRLVYVLTQIGKMIEATDIEERLKAMEEQCDR